GIHMAIPTAGVSFDVRRISIHGSLFRGSFGNFRSRRHPHDFAYHLALALPSILAVLILLLITGLEAFETPALLGLSGKVLVFSTLIYLNRSFAPSDIGLASAYAVFMLIISIGFLCWYMRMTRRERAFATITGKGFRPRRIRLGRWGIPVAAT